MEMLKNFLSTHYQNAIKLKERFKCIEPKEWNSLIVSNELVVQYAHLINSINQDEDLNEEGRNIVNTNDEISDVLLQLCYLGYLEQVDFSKIENYHVKEVDIKLGIVLLGQLVEALMEKEGYRFKKNRCGFQDNQQFIEDRIVKLLLIIYNFSKNNNINIVSDFKLMLEDASAFLDNYVQ